MDNTQVTAKDGSWFLFADWQGMTRIGLPGDKVKTDANLDRPHQTNPLVLRPNGLVWSQYAVDIDPVTLKRVKQAEPGHDSPDPLDGPEIAVGHAGDTISVRGVKRKLEASGDELQLGGAPSRREPYGRTRYNMYPDHTLVVFGEVTGRTQVSLVTRAPDGAGRIAWCRPIALTPNGSPDAFRSTTATTATTSTTSTTTTWLADRDLVENIAHLLEIHDDGTVMSEAHTPAVAGPWVFDGQVWWQPDDATLCAGPRLGSPDQSFTLPAEHAGPGRLLRLSGRKLFLPWHGVSILDLAPAKPGKGELSRKHKAAEMPMYREAERLLRPIRAGMAKRGVRVRWFGCRRHGKHLQLNVAIDGRSDLVTHILGYALQGGAAAKLESTGAGSVDFAGGGVYDEILSPRAPTGVQDIRDLIAMLDAAGLSRAVGIGSLQPFANIAAQRKLPLPLTPEAEDLALAAVISGLRQLTGAPPEPIDAIPPATAASLATVAHILRDHDRLRLAGINGSETARFINATGQRRFGPRAAESTHQALLAMNPTYALEEP